MSEYWVSQQKKYCEFCQCWYADNKASVDFHERGAKHKANVQKKLGQIQTKSIQSDAEERRFASEMAKIEAAALRALEKDAMSNSFAASELERVRAAQGGSSSRR